MKTKQKRTKVVAGLLAVCSVCFLPLLSVAADGPAAVEWTDIPVVVNIIDASDASKVDEAIKKANEILKQAKIRLIVKKTNPDVNVGNGDGNLTENEGDRAQKDGQTELDKVAGAGKGIKITIADDVWTEEPATNGWCIHGNPVVFVETDDADTMGNVIAHEIIHSLTVSGHSTDSNDVMYPYTPRGTDVRPSDVNEIRTSARTRGSSRWELPIPWPWLGPVALPIGVNYSIDGHGAILDAFSDLLIVDPMGLITNPDDPSIQYADLREIVIFADEPFDPLSTVTLQIQLGGPPAVFPVESFFDVYFDLNPINPGAEGIVQFQVIGGFPGPAVWRDMTGGPDIALPMPVIHENERLDGSIPLEIANNSIEVTIPIEIISLNLVSAEPIYVQVSAMSNDLRNGPALPIMLQDDTNQFAFGLTPPCTCPGLQMNAFALFGCGFTAGSQIGIEIDANLIGTATAKPDGTFIHFLEVELEPGSHAVIAKDLDDSGPTGATHAIGYFQYCPGGKIVGDLDNDCDEDFFDLAIFGGHWLEGVE
ncbi:MAG: hypothetical protein ACYS91_08000 [Planctomycetota bacterium]|jgi:hypothetical protein